MIEHKAEQLMIYNSSVRLTPAEGYWHQTQRHLYSSILAQFKPIRNVLLAGNYHPAWLMMDQPTDQPSPGYDSYMRFSLKDR